MREEIVLKNKTAIVRTEVVMPSDDLIARIVNERICELLSDAQAAELQPFFERPEVAEVMRRTQHVIERRKWIWYFEEHGCLICERSDVRQGALGMCQRCLVRTRERLSTVKRRHAPEVATEAFRDTMQLAREALRPSVENLAPKRGGK